MEFKLIAKEDESILSLNGDLTLLHAAQFKTELIRALDSSPRVVIDTEDLSEINTVCLQLICSAHQSAQAKGNELLLAELETALMELEESPDDMELIDRVFRGMHTINRPGSLK